MAKKLTWIQAAEIAGMSVRNMQRKRQAYRLQGAVRPAARQAQLSPSSDGNGGEGVGAVSG